MLIGFLDFKGEFISKVETLPCHFGKVGNILFLFRHRCIFMGKELDSVIGSLVGYYLYLLSIAEVPLSLKLVV
jgi:hypothetical protein